jgi:hypothetical protein
MPKPLFLLSDLQTLLAGNAGFQQDANILALTMFGEGRNESIVGRVAIGWTAHNRSLAKGQSVTERCLQRLQYSCWWPHGGVMNYRRVLDLAEKVFTQKELGTDSSLFTECRYLAIGVLDWHLKDYTHGATHYMTRQLYNTGTVAWAKGRMPILEVGAHVFFAGVSWS